MDTSSKTPSNDDTNSRYPVNLKNSTFIEGLKEHNFIILPNPMLLGYDGLSKDARLCYGHLLRYGLFSIMNGYVDAKGNPIVFMSKETLGRDMDLSRATISRYLGELQTHSLIAVRRRGQGDTDEITLFVPKPKGAYYERRTESATTKRQESATQYTESQEAEKDQDIAVAPTLSGDDVIRQTIELGLARQRKVREPTGTDEAKTPKKNANTMLSHFSGLYRMTFGSTEPLVTGKERKQAKELIEHYGYDTVESMITWTIMNWAAFKKDKRLDGAPTLGLVYGFRAFLTEKLGMAVAAASVKLDDGDESAW